MLNVKFADAYVDLTIDTRKYVQGLAFVRASLLRMPTAHTIDIRINRMVATANINLMIQQLRAAQALTRFNLTATRGPGWGMGGGGRGGMGGYGGGGFVAGLGHGLGLPFATSPQMMAGQMVGGAVAGSVRTAAGLQTQLAELQRVTGMQAGIAATLKQSLFDVSTIQAGVSVQDLVEISQIGGRAGVADREGPAGLLTFTKDLAMVKNSIGDMPTEELASSMIKVLNVFELGTDRVAGFGSALTAMDNVSVASAKDILAITTGLSGTAQAIGMTLPQTLAFASVLKDVGLTNQLAAGSFSQIFRKMATDSGKFAAQIGVDAKTFADAYRRDPMEALGMVIHRFKEMNDTIEGQEFLSGLGFKGVRAAGSLQQLAAKFDLVADRAKIASQETDSLNALMRANELKSGTLEASWVKLKNALTALSDAMGEPFIGPATGMANALTGITKALSQGDWGILSRLLSVSVGPETNIEGKSRVERRKDLEDWWMKNVFGNDPAKAALPIVAGVANALPAKKPELVGPPDLSKDKALNEQRLEALRFQVKNRLGNALGVFGDVKQGLIGAGMRGLGGLPGLPGFGEEKPRPHFAAGLTGEEAGRRIQEDILNMANRSAEETAKNTRPLPGLLGEIRDILGRGAQNIGAVLGQ